MKFNLNSKALILLQTMMGYPCNLPLNCCIAHIQCCIAQTEACQ